MMGMATAGAIAADSSSIWAVPDECVKEALRGPGIVTFRNVVCSLCPAGCGVRYRLIDGVPVHVDGNPHHPVSAGGICPHGAAALDFQYNPDRVRQPLKRVGPPFASTQWKEIAWDEAFDLLATHLRVLRTNGSPERAAFLVGRTNNTLYQLIERFMSAFGSPNLVHASDRALDAIPYRTMFGWNQVPASDLANARCVISFGSAFTEGGTSPVRDIRAYSQMRESWAKERGRFVYVGSRHSLTASCADRFVAIRPGTHGAFALGVANILIREKLYDIDYVKRHVSGFSDWTDAHGVRHKGFKDYVLESFSVERVSDITGAKPKRIRDTAMQFGRFRPSVALINDSGWDAPNGFWNSLCVLALNTLVGAPGARGGLRRQRMAPLADLPAASLDLTARRGLDTMEAGPEHSLSIDPLVSFIRKFEAGEMSPVEVAIVHGCNPAFDHPFARRARSVLGRIPFVVSLTDVLDEVTAFADLVLPVHGPLEGWDDTVIDGGAGFACASVSEPTVKPFYDTRNPGDILLTLAKRMGGPVKKSLPFANYEEVLRHRYKGLYRSRRGHIAGMKSRPDGFETFWKKLIENGAWYEPVDEGKRDAIDRPRGRVPLYIEDIAVMARTRGGRINPRVVSEWNIRQGGDAIFVPHYEEPDFERDGGAYPLQLVPFAVLANRRGTGSFSPLLQEMFGYTHRVYWDSWVELNPQTAHENHITHGDVVAITSKEGSLLARAVINPALEPSVVAVPFGMGHTAGGRYAKGVGINPYEILVERVDPLWGRPMKSTTTVRISHSRRKLS